MKNINKFLILLIICLFSCIVICAVLESCDELEDGDYRKHETKIQIHGKNYSFVEVKLSGETSPLWLLIHQDISCRQPITIRTNEKHGKTTRMKTIIIIE